jgi:hypothetical protein
VLHPNTQHRIATILYSTSLSVSHLECHREPHNEGVVHVPQYGPLCLRVLHLVLPDNIIFLENLWRIKRKKRKWNKSMEVTRQTVAIYGIRWSEFLFYWFQTAMHLTRIARSGQGQDEEIKGDKRRTKQSWGEEREEKHVWCMMYVRTFRACRVWFALSRTRKTFPKLPVVKWEGGRWKWLQ